MVNSGMGTPGTAVTSGRRCVFPLKITFAVNVEEALRPEMLNYYDEVILYANHTNLKPEQEKALLDFVEGGKGLVAIHCASAMFTNSPKFIAMVGGQFQKHGIGVVGFWTEVYGVSNRLDWQARRDEQIVNYNAKLK